MSLSSADIANIRDLATYATPLLTTVVAIIAIMVGRLSSKDAIQGQWRQEIWKKRSELYLNIVSLTDKQDPGRRPTPEGFQETVRQNEGTVQFHAIDLDSYEWCSFVHQVETYSSDDVLRLFHLWDNLLQGWTWAMTKALIHIEPDSSAHEESKKELAQTYKRIYAARQELLIQIRAELRFERRSMRKIFAHQDELGLITEARFDRRTGPSIEKTVRAPWERE